MDFTEAETAEDVFRIARREDPEHWAELELAFPVADSPDDTYRHQNGVRRQHRSTGREHTNYIPKSKRRQFSDAEWRRTRSEWKAWLKEQRLDYALAKELADEGMYGY